MARPRDNKRFEDGRSCFLGPIRISPADRAEIVANAKEQMMTVSDYVVVCCLKRARSPVFDPKQFMEELDGRLTTLEGAVGRLERMAGLGGFE